MIADPNQAGSAPVALGDPGGVPDPLSDGIAALRRRALAGSMLRAYWSTQAGLAAIFVAAALTRAVAVPAGDRLWVLAAAVFLPAAAATVRCAAVRVPVAQIARLADQRAHLQDRTASALELTGRAHPGEMAALLRLDARGALAQADVREIVPLRRDIIAAAVVLAATLLLCLWHAPQTIGAFVTASGSSRGRSPFATVQRARPLDASSRPASEPSRPGSQEPGSRSASPARPSASGARQAASRRTAGGAENAAGSSATNHAGEVSASRSSAEPQRRGAAGAPRGKPPLAGSGSRAAGIQTGPHSGGKSQPGPGARAGQPGKGSGPQNGGESSGPRQTETAQGAPGSRKEAHGKSGAGAASGHAKIRHGAGAGLKQGRSPGAPASAMSPGAAPAASGATGSSGPRPAGGPRSGGADTPGNPGGAPGAVTGNRGGNNRAAIIHPALLPPIANRSPFSFRLPRPQPGATRDRIDSGGRPSKGRPGPAGRSLEPHGAGAATAPVAARIQHVEQDPNIPAGYRRLVERYFAGNGAKP